MSDLCVYRHHATATAARRTTPPGAADSLTAGDVTVLQVRPGTTVDVWPRYDTRRDLVAVAMFHRPPPGAGRWHGHTVARTDRTPTVPGRPWRVPNGYGTIMVTVPRARLDVPDVTLDRIADEHQLNRSPVLRALVRPMLLGMIDNLGQLSTADSSAFAGLWVAALTMIARSLGQRRPGRTARSALAREFIDANLADRALGPEAVADALHVSRRTLYTELAHVGGVAALIRRLRLERAHQLLADPRHRHRTIAEIAAEVGLPSGAHFSRLYRNAYGISPRQARSRSPLRTAVSDRVL